MNHLLAQQLDDLFRPPAGAQRLACEDELRAAAGTLSRASDSEVTATRAVGVLGIDDRPCFEALVHDIAAEFGVEATVSLHPGTFSVRFTRPTAAPPAVRPPSGLKAALVGLRSAVRA